MGRGKEPSPGEVVELDELLLSEPAPARVPAADPFDEPLLAEPASAVASPAYPADEPLLADPASALASAAYSPDEPLQPEPGSAFASAELDELLIPEPAPAPPPARAARLPPPPVLAGRPPAGPSLQDDPTPPASRRMARLATLRIHPAIAVGVSAIAALVGWVAYQELLNPRAEPQIAAATAPTPSSPVPRPVVAPTPAPPTAAPLPAAKPLPPGDEPLYAGRPLTWWNERLVLLAGQQGDEARRLHALTVRRAESLGLRARTDGGTVVLDRPAEAEAR